MSDFPFSTIDLGTLPYAQALALQRQHVEAVLTLREAGTPEVGRLLLVEHPPVITVSNRPTAMSNLLASPEALTAAGVMVEPTDRGGDITYHGPGQLVAYPIFDLDLLGVRIHEHMRMLEEAVIDLCSAFDVVATRDPAATGVWVSDSRDLGEPGAKICAMGVRVRRWVSMHGLAINVTTNLDHFDLIVPCGLAGRQVTSLKRLLGSSCPTMAEVKVALARCLGRAVTIRMDAKALRRNAEGS